MGLGVRIKARVGVEVGIRLGVKIWSWVCFLGVVGIISYRNF